MAMTGKCNDKKYCVYCHTNNANGKKYIGITSQKPESRWKNGDGYRYNKHFYNAILKYGWDNFSHEILFSNLSASEASEKEIFLIKALRTAEAKYGYNQSFGGEYNKGGITEETRRKLSYASSHISEETREKHRKNLIERNKSSEFQEKRRKAILAADERRAEEIREIFSHYWSQPRTDEWKRRIALARGKKVLCIESGEVFDSIKLAAISLGVHRSSINNVLNGRAVTAGGKHFLYVDGKNEKVRQSKNRSKMVVCIETGEIFDNANDAAIKFQTCVANIRHCLSGRYAHAKGFTFAYVE